ncbi:MAG: hypothetical protein AAGF23_07165 [Acidobacteriota bacterium]
MKLFLKVCLLVAVVGACSLFLAPVEDTEAAPHYFCEDLAPGFPGSGSPLYYPCFWEGTKQTCTLYKAGDGTIFRDAGCFPP